MLHLKHLFILFLVICAVSNLAFGWNESYSYMWHDIRYSLSADEIASIPLLGYWEDTDDQIFEEVGHGQISIEEFEATQNSDSTYP